MKLKSIRFIENKGLASEWALDELTLGSINLIVGKNATGKSRTINIIYHLASIIAGNKVAPGISYSFSATFCGEQKTTIEFDVNNGVVEKEVLTIDGDIKIKKEPNKSTTDIYFSTLKQFLSTEHTPQFLSTSQRDKIQKPYLEPLLNWASNTILTLFGTTLGQDSLYLFNPESESIALIKKSDAVASHLKSAEERGLLQSLKDETLKDLQEIGYNLSDIGHIEVNVVPGSGDSNNHRARHSAFRIYAKENGVKSPVYQENMSQGMFRAISVIVHFNYMILNKVPCCLLIDDIGEGLDFERSSALINILCRKAQSSDYQLIMTSNDRFVMNQVPLDYWSVLVRTGRSCRSINQNNSPDVFKDFKFTGLNNFDFFSSEFYQG